MTAIVLEPHQDDAILFSCFNLIRHRAQVVTVLASQLQWDRGTAITNDSRVVENQRAIAHELGLPLPEQWPYSDANPDWAQIEIALRMLDERLEPEILFAPAVEDDGHEHHNAIGELADKVFGGRVTHYQTYRRHNGKTRAGTEVPFELPWITLKLRALACYRTQIETEAASCYQHFAEDLREYVA